MLSAIARLVARLRTGNRPRSADWRAWWPFTPARASSSHSIFDQFADYEGWAEPGFERGFYGVNVRDWLYTGESKGLTDRRQVWPGRPPVDEEYFEWIALLVSVAHADRRFCFAEIGAGWGRWMVSAAALCRQRNLPCHLIGVEAEPSHFEWIKMVLRDNELHPDEHDLFLGAVAERDRDDVLLTGPEPPEKVWGHRTIHENDMPAWIDLPGYKLRTVEGFSLATVLANCDRVDLVDVDIQGVEHEVVVPAFDTLNQKVSVIHIGTHSDEAETALRRAFRRHGWRNAFDHPHHRQVRTRYGPVYFTDGVQTWVNPRCRDLWNALNDR